MLNIGAYVIVQGYGSGVHVGELVGFEAPEVVFLKNARKALKWDKHERSPALTISGLAKQGIANNPAGTQFSMPVPFVTLVDIAEGYEIEPPALESVQSAAWEGRPIRTPIHDSPRINKSTGQFVPIDMNPLEQWCLITTYAAGIFVAPVLGWSTTKNPEMVDIGGYDDLQSPRMEEAGFKVVEWTEHGDDAQGSIFTRFEMAQFGPGRGSVVERAPNGYTSVVVEMVPITNLALAEFRRQCKD